MSTSNPGTKEWRKEITAASFHVYKQPFALKVDQMVEMVGGGRKEAAEEEE